MSVLPMHWLPKPLFALILWRGMALSFVVHWRFKPFLTYHVRLVKLLVCKSQWYHQDLGDAAWVYMHLSLQWDGCDGKDPVVYEFEILNCGGRAWRKTACNDCTCTCNTQMWRATSTSIELSSSGSDFIQMKKNWLSGNYMSTRGDLYYPHIV